MFDPGTKQDDGCSQGNHEHHDKTATVEILVNEKKIHIVGHHATAHHIKQSAIEQGLSIQLDFRLFKENDEGLHLIPNDEKVHLRNDERFVALPQEVVILVNNRKIKMVGHRATGLEIKQAAIKQGAPIQLDFVLSKEICAGQDENIGDSQSVRLYGDEKFDAIAPDDNS